jgi:hypothetical protein
MPENKAIKNNRQFLIEWSILNSVGCIIGFYVVFLIQSKFVFTYYKISILQTILGWLPLGASIAVFQWFKIRRLGINLFLWVFVTALGSSLLITSVYFVTELRYDANLIPQVRIYLGEYIGNINIGKNIATLLGGMAILLGGLVTSGLQEILMRRIIPRPWQWVRASVFGLLLPAIMMPLTFFFKLMVLSTIYFFDHLISFYRLFGVGDIAIFLLPYFLALAISISTSLPTGKVLIETINAKSNPGTG